MNSSMLLLRFVARAMFCSLGVGIEALQEGRAGTRCGLTSASCVLATMLQNICAALCAALVDHRVDELTGLSSPFGCGPSFFISSINTRSLFELSSLEVSF